MTRPTSIRILIAVLAMAVAAAACGGDEAANDGVATLQDDTVVAGNTPQRAEIEDAVLGFTRCMRDEGVEVPDIQLGADGAPQLDPQRLQGIDLEAPEFQSAFTTCIGIIADAGAFEFDFDPEIEAIVQDQLQAFAECMRGEGIEDFPDPEVGGSGPPFPLTAFTNLADESFQTALETCQQETAFSELEE
ncbi:MAG: hypothetical protein OEU32_17570 [Acidimicrobiia bacterium]|nr:hypothetical protein [Acidimicrobiia bacterium]